MNTRNDHQKRMAILAGFIALLLVVLAPYPVKAEEPPGTFIPAPCMFEGFNLGLTTLTGERLGFECGYVVVPERHANPEGPTLRLPVAIRRATGANPQPDPLLLAQGGPGGDAFEIFSLLVPNTKLAENRDIVIFNQRGTFYAEPVLSCPEIKDILADLLKADWEEGQALYDQAIIACYDRLAASGVDLSAYNSLENAADVAAIARALNYEEYNFYGVSYGTLLGLHLMRNHPEGLRSVILDSVVPTDINFLAEAPASEDRVLSEVFAACEDDPKCREAYPNLEERFYSLVRRFDEKPVTTMLTDTKTGQRYETYLDGKALRGVLFQLLYLPRMNAVLPKVIYDLERGDLRYIQAMWPLFAFDETVAEGMYYSVICAEDADIDLSEIDLDQVRPEIAATAEDDILSIVNLCRRWEVETLPNSVDDPVVSDIPTLLLSGRFDPVTPPEFAEAAAARLRHAVNLVDPTASHGVAFFNPCVNTIMADFLDDPLSQPDSSCLLQSEVSPVVPPGAKTLPILARINSPDQGVLTLVGLGSLLMLIVLSPFVVWPLVWFGRTIANRPAPVAPGNRRLRILSRVLLLSFGFLAFLFVTGILGVILFVLGDQSYATALALPPSAAPILWLPIVLLAIAVALVAIVFMLWGRPAIGSVAGKVYYTVVVVSAVMLVFLIVREGMLPWPV